MQPDDNIFADYSFSWAPGASFINEPATAITSSRLSRQYVAVQHAHEAPPTDPSRSLRNVRSILKQPSQRLLDEDKQPGAKHGLRRSGSLYSETFEIARSNKPIDKHTSLPPNPSRTSVISKRLSLASLFTETDSGKKRRRNKLKKRSRQSLCVPSAVSREPLCLPPGITQSGRGIGYTHASTVSRSHLSLTNLSTKACFSALGALLGGKNDSAENLPRSRNDVMQHIYGSNWSVAHTNEAVMSTVNFGIPDGLGRRVDSIDGGSNFATATMAPKRSMEAKFFTNHN